MLSAVLVFAICCPYLSCLRFHPVPLCLCPKPYNLVSLDLSVKGASAADPTVLTTVYYISTDYIFTKVYYSISCSVLHLYKSIHCSVKGASAADVESL